MYFSAEKSALFGDIMIVYAESKVPDETGKGQADLGVHCLQPWQPFSHVAVLVVSLSQFSQVSTKYEIDGGLHVTICC